MEMHRCHDDYFVRIDAVQKSVREAMNKTPTRAQAENRPPFRMFANTLNGRVDFVQKVDSEARRLEFVVPRRLEHLEFGWKKKADGLHLNTARASWRTSSAPRAEMFPFLYS